MAQYHPKDEKNLRRWMEKFALALLVIFVCGAFLSEVLIK